MTGGTVEVTAGGGSTATPSDDVSAKGLKAGVILVLEAGTVDVDAADDAVHSNGAVHLSGGALTAASGADGVHAEEGLIIDDGTVTVTASTEGLEGADIAISGGSTSVTSSDDGINAAGGSTSTTPQGGGGGEQVGDFSLVISGGTLVVDAGGDGLDSNGTASITGGTVVVNGPTTSGTGALDVNGSFEVSGGVLLAAGSSGMVVSPAAGSAQGWISATLTSAVKAGSVVQIVDGNGTVVATFVTAKTAQSIVFSSAAITSGAQYQIYIGGTATGTGVGGLSEGGSLGSATSAVTVTAGQAAAGGGFGGGGPR